VQVAVLSISEKTNEYAAKVTQQLKDAGLRVEANLGSEKIGAKIRDATLAKVPYMLIVGEKEAAEGKVALRHRTEGDKGAVPMSNVLEQLRGEVVARR
jgi:threonyl-tRNA synthetase